MKITLYIVLLFFSSSAFAQILSETMINHIPDYTLSLEINSDGTFHFSYNKPGALKSASFTLTENEPKAFENGFKKLIKADMKTLRLIEEDKSGKGDSVFLADEVRALFYYFKAVENISGNLKYRPIAGMLDVNNRDFVPVYKILEDQWILKARARDSIRIYKMNSKPSVGNKLKKEKLIQTLNALIEIKRPMDDSIKYLTDSIYKITRQLISSDSMKEVRDSLSTLSLSLERFSKLLKAKKNRNSNLKEEISRLENIISREKEKIDSINEYKTILFNKRRRQEEFHREIENLNLQLDKFNQSSTSKLWLWPFKKRWFFYDGERHGRKEFKILLQEDIPKRDDYERSTYGIPRYKDLERKKQVYERNLKTTIDSLLSLKKTNEESLKKTKAILAVLSRQIYKLRPDAISCSRAYEEVVQESIKKNSSFSMYRPPNPKSSQDSDSYNSVLNSWYADVLSYLNDQLLNYQSRRDTGDYKAKRKLDKNIADIKKRINTWKDFSKSAEFNRLKDTGLNLNKSHIELKNSEFKNNAAISTKDSINMQLKKINPKVDELKKSLLEDITKYYNKDIYEQYLRVRTVQIEITDGFIENMLVTGEVGNKFIYINDRNKRRDTLVCEEGDGKIKLANKHPFGFSRKVDYDNLKYKYLYVVEKNTPGFRLYLKDIFTAKTFIEKLQNFRRDYCPSDTVITIAEDQINTHFELKKEPTYKLFEAKIFSDFVGLDGSSPNGLIQTEIDKRMGLVTNRRPWGRTEWSNWGYLSYVTPSVTLSKLEQSNKDLLLNRIDTVEGKYAPIKYASTLDLRRHENLRVGFDLNLLLLDIPNFKSTFLLDFGLRYGRVSIADSAKANINGTIRKIGSKYGANTFRIYPRLGWKIRTDERYSFYFEGGVNWFWLREDSFKQVANNDVFKSSQNGGGHDVNKYINFLFEADLRIDAIRKVNRGHLFFRYQYNYQWNYFNTGFHQAQVGYSAYLLGNR